MLKKRRLVGIVLLLAVIAIICGSVVLSRLNQPVSGTIKMSDDKVQTGYSISFTPKKAVGKYVSFSYPSGMTPKKASPVSAPEVEELAFSARDVSSWLLAVDVSTPRGGTIDGDSGYTYRKANPGIYQASQLIVNDQVVEVMTDTTAGFSKVAYLMHGPLLATVALSGEDTAGTKPLEVALTMVLNSFRWLQ